ncbi:hypothetical protein DUI87_12279 [Hirundo rustica rustica]|uniref:RNase H type-1 domain-containing protein n=1 Tax=Hirundo rustica rustica TaxID=333673 RepID=A0A3M0KVG2_HIRRU|nr:hypothetical protein DUI87_12279 [Hirundo rustica rustica]
MVANALWGWLNRWKKANWQRRGKPIWAAEIWQDIAARVEKLTVKVRHVDAHVSKSQANEEHHNNEQVDKAAKVKVSQVDLDWQHKGEVFLARWAHDASGHQGRDATYRWARDRGVDLTMDNISQVIHNCETCAAIKQAKRVKPLWYSGRWLKYRYEDQASVSCSDSITPSGCINLASPNVTFSVTPLHAQFLPAPMSSLVLLSFITVGVTVEDNDYYIQSEWSKNLKWRMENKNPVEGCASGSSCSTGKKVLLQNGIGSFGRSVVSPVEMDNFDGLPEDRPRLHNVTLRAKVENPVELKKYLKEIGTMMALRGEDGCSKLGPGICLSHIARDCRAADRGKGRKNTNQQLPQSLRLQSTTPVMEPAARLEPEPESAAKADSKPKPLAVAPAKKHTVKTDRPVNDNDPREGPSPKSKAKASSTRSEANIDSFSLKDLRGLRRLPATT